MQSPIDDADVIHEGSPNALAGPLRGLLDGLPEAAIDALVTAIVPELTEVAAPAAEETTRGAHRRLDGSGYRVFRSQDDDALKAMKATLKGFKAAFEGDVKGALVSISTLGRMLFLLSRYAVEVDWITGAALAQLEGHPEGRTSAQVADQLPPAWGVTAGDVSDVLGALLGRTFKDGKPLVVRVGERWTAPHL